jgi:hypothetical protein
MFKHEMYMETSLGFRRTFILKRKFTETGGRHHEKAKDTKATPVDIYLVCKASPIVANSAKVNAAIRASLKKKFIGGSS